jgi:toxin ParE1/3/4
MAAELVWDPQARSDLLEIYLTIGLDSPAAAERIYTRIETKVNLLVDHPRLGPRRPDIRPNTRIMVERPYLVLSTRRTPTPMTIRSTTSRSFVSWTLAGI